MFIKKPSSFLGTAGKVSTRNKQITTVISCFDSYVTLLQFYPLLCLCETPLK